MGFLCVLRDLRVSKSGELGRVGFQQLNKRKAGGARGGSGLENDYENVERERLVLSGGRRCGVGGILTFHFLHRGFAREADLAGALVDADAFHPDRLARLHDVFGATAGLKLRTGTEAAFSAV